MKINEKIKRLREGKHWSQEEMAQKLNMSKNGYAKIERGETSVSLGRLEQVAAFWASVCANCWRMCAAVCCTSIVRMMRVATRKMYYCCNRRDRLLN